MTVPLNVSHAKVTVSDRNSLSVWSSLYQAKVWNDCKIVLKSQYGCVAVYMSGGTLTFLEEIKLCDWPLNSPS